MIAPAPSVDFDPGRLLQAVFDPQPGEKALVLCDTPHPDVPDNEAWADRRRMACEWRESFARTGVAVMPLLTYPATGAHNAELPRKGEMEGRPVNVPDVLAEANLVVAMTEFSATAPLTRLARPGAGGRRIVSMPGVTRSMEQTALAADTREVARRARHLRDLLESAEEAEVIFSTGDRMIFDLRYRQAHADDGLCTPDKEIPVINLPSGEAYQAPYEGELREVSATAGLIPIVRADSLIRLEVEGNRIRRVRGRGPVAKAMRAYFAIDPARTNIAEFGLGCNPRARVTGRVLEDEKAGFHWAYGRSDHLGGKVGPELFLRPEYVVHHDEVYAAGSPVGVRQLILHTVDGPVELMRDSNYLIF